MGCAIWFGGLLSILRDLHDCIRPRKTKHTEPLWTVDVRLVSAGTRVFPLLTTSSLPQSFASPPPPAAYLQGHLLFQSHLLLLACEFPGASSLRFDLGNCQRRAGMAFPICSKSHFKKQGESWASHIFLAGCVCGCKNQLLKLSCKKWNVFSHR